MSEPLSLYVHVPFCRRRCPYCDFYSAACPGDAPDWYVSLIESESRRWSAALCGAGRSVHTFFVGGGTPSLLTSRQLRRVLRSVTESFPTNSPPAEFTVECNPDSLDHEKAAVMAACGANRVSIGAQALDDPALARLGRIHSADQIARAVSVARGSGITNINLDLLFGFPEQSLSSWTDTLNHALDLAPTHLSCYSLTLAPDTPFANLAKQGALALPDEDQQAEMADAAHDILTGAGFLHYEISNYALPGHECRHNLAFWHGADYVGLGPGSTSCLSGVRWKVTLRGRSPVVQGEALSPDRRLRERAILAFRTSRGLARGDLTRLLGPEEAARWLDRWHPLLSTHQDEYNTDRVALSARGMMVADEVVGSLL